MKKWMPVAEWEHLVPKSVGKVRVNHVSDDCAGGRNSMLIERKLNGDVTAYCFRCSGCGYIPGTRHFVRPTGRYEDGGASDDAAGSEGKESELPDDRCSDTGRWPGYVIRWLMGGGITPVIAKANGFTYSYSRDKLFIPVSQGSLMTAGEKTVAFLARGFNPKSYKYIAVERGKVHGYYVSEAESDPATVCIVEDVLSAIRVSEHVDAIALLGTEMHSPALSQVLTSGYTRAIVFLDGDNPTVRMKARKIASQLGFIQTKVIDTGSDPKSYDSEELKDLLLTIAW